MDWRGGVGGLGGGAVGVTRVKFSAARDLQDGGAAPASAGPGWGGSHGSWPQAPSTPGHHAPPSCVELTWVAGSQEEVVDGRSAGQGRAGSGGSGGPVEVTSPASISPHRDSGDSEDEAPTGEAARQVERETVASPAWVTQEEEDGAEGQGRGGGQAWRHSCRGGLPWEESGAQGGLVPPVGLELLTSEEQGSGEPGEARPTRASRLPATTSGSASPGVTSPSRVDTAATLPASGDTLPRDADGGGERPLVEEEGSEHEGEGEGHGEVVEAGRGGSSEEEGEGGRAAMLHLQHRLSDIYC